jgi:hypothetical protein
MSDNLNRRRFFLSMGASGFGRLLFNLFFIKNAQRKGLLFGWWIIKRR